MLQIFWIIYLGILAVSSLGFLVKGSYKTTAAKIDFVISLITWVGLFGYVTDNQILTPLVWKFVFVGALLWDVIFSFNSKYYIGDDTLDDMPQPLRSIFVTVVLIVTIGPLYYGLFRYAFNETHILLSLVSFVAFPLLVALCINKFLNFRRETMTTKKVSLPYGWTLVIHESYSLYASQDDNNKFAVLDHENEAVVTFSIEKDTFETHSNTFDFKQKINTKKQIIEIIHEPEEWD